MAVKKLLLAAGMLGGLATGASAAVIPVLDTVTPDGSDFTFAYTGTLAGDEGLVNGSQLVIFDFAGYVPGSISAVNPDIVPSVELTSTLTPPPGFSDDPTLFNLVFTWEGGDFQTSGGPFAEIEFSGLSADSTFSGVTLDGFAAMTVTNNGAATGKLAFNDGEVGVPRAAVPEPDAWALLILGFSGLGAALRTRRARIAAA
jgi:hypothetical protein